MQLNYTCLFAVERTTSNGHYFSATCQKRTEQLLNDDGTPKEDPQYFDNSTTFEDLLRTGEVREDNGSSANQTSYTFEQFSEFTFDSLSN